MGYAFGHLALFVSDLQGAEAFYRQVFGLEVLFREAEGEDGFWYTLPHGTNWVDAERLGREVGMVALHRDDVILPIFHGSPQRGTVLEIGVTVPQEEIEAISTRLPDGATRLGHEYGDLMFSDPFGYTLHINSASDGYLSNGEAAGRWLEI